MTSIFPVVRLMALLSSIIILTGCAGSPARPYTINSADRVPKVAASPTVSITGLTEYPELRSKLQQTLTQGGLTIADSSAPDSAQASLKITIDDRLRYAYDSRAVTAYELGGQKVAKGRQLLAQLENGGWIGLTWTDGKLPSQPFFTSRAIHIELTAQGKTVYTHGGELILSSDKQSQVTQLYYIYPERLTDTTLPCACLTALGRYSLLKTGTDAQRVWMLWWIGEFKCTDAQSQIEELKASGLNDRQKAFCDEILEKLRH